jgi:hypothetical protein
MMKLWEEWWKKTLSLFMVNEVSWHPILLDASSNNYLTI